MSEVGWITGEYSPAYTWFLVVMGCMALCLIIILPILWKFKVLKPTLRDKRFCLCIQGKTFLDDLAFSYWYHKNHANQILHQVSLILILVCLMIIYLKVFPPLILLPFIQFFIYAWIDPIGSVLWLVFYFLVMVVIIGVRIAPHLYLFITCCILIVVLLLFQLLGHQVFEKALPAFRIFELIWTTPLLMMMDIAWKCGYDPQLEQQIILMSKQWQPGGTTAASQKNDSSNLVEGAANQ